MNSDGTLRRVIIKGTLTTCSPFHTGTGEIENSSNSDDSLPVNVVAKDAQEKPYIPGSTIRGFLRHQVEDSELKYFLFGHARQSAESTTEGRIGALRVYDAVFTNDFQRLLQTRNSIEPVIGTAKQHHIYTEEYVPTGSTFSLELQLESVESSIDQAALETIMGSLERINQIPIGKSTSIGQGHMEWNPAVAIAISKNDILNWLKQTGKKSPGALWKNLLKKRTISYKKNNSIFQTNEKHLVPLDWKSLRYQLINVGPLLINDPLDPEVKANDTNNERSQNAPNLVSMKRGNEYLLPGSTMKGWFRAHCRRVLLTITQGTREDHVDELIGQMFGSATTDGNASLIRFDDATSPVTGAHEQTFTAVDRFTGGVKGSALYQIKAVSSGHIFAAAIHINEKKIKDWMKLIMVHAWSDALRGDIRIGWGKSRGYGQMEVRASEILTHWTGNTTEKYQQWQNSLNAQLQLGDE